VWNTPDAGRVNKPDSFINPPAGGIFFWYSPAIRLVNIFNMTDPGQKKLTGRGDANVGFNKIPVIK
jgi:hypothetical protein